MTFVEQFANNAQTTLTAAVTSTPDPGTPETWTVASTTKFPQSGQFRLVCAGGEIVKVTAVLSTTQIAVARGSENTTPVAQPIGTVLTAVITEGAIRSLLADYLDTSTPQQITGNKAFQHLSTIGPVPTLTIGAGAGTGATATIFGTDTRGTITIVCGTSPAADTNFATVTFASPFVATVAAVVNAASATAASANLYVSSQSSSSFIVRAKNAPAGTVVFNYDVMAVNGTTSTPPTPPSGVNLLWSDEFGGANGSSWNNTNWDEVVGVSSQNYANVVGALSGLELWAYLNESTGTVAGDSSTNARNGTYTGATLNAVDDMALAAGLSTAAVTLSPSASVSFAHNAAFNLDTQAAKKWTVVMDVKDGSAAGQYPVLLAKGNANSNGFVLFYDHTNAAIGYKVNGTQYAAPFSLATAKQIALVWDGTNLKLYSGGVAVGSWSFAATNFTVSDTGPLTVGGGGQFTVAKLVITSTDQTANLPTVASSVGVQIPASSELHVFTAGTANKWLDGSGNLVIEARRQSTTFNGNTYQYTSGRLEGKHAFTNGYMEIRAKLPTWAGVGPELGVTGSDHLWPASGDLAFQNQSGVVANKTQIRMTTHGQWPGHPETTPPYFWQLGWDNGWYDTAPANPGDDWHTFGILIDTDNSIKTYIDRKHYDTWTSTNMTASFSGGTWAFGVKSQVPFLALTVGGPAGSVDAAVSSDRMTVDYVRIYDALPFTATEGTTGSGSGSGAGTGGSGGTRNLTSPATNGAVLLWYDDFTGANGTALSSTNWTQMVGAPTNSGRLEYDTGGTHNAWQDGTSNAVIQYRREAYGGRNYTSARFESNQKLTVGYMECLAKVGTWPGWSPGFWCYAYPWGSSTGGSEIDYECVSMTDPHNERISIHGWSSSGQFVTLGWDTDKIDFSPNYPGTAWHRWGFYFDTTKVEFWLDGVMKKRWTSADLLAAGASSWPYGHFPQQCVLECEAIGYAYSPNGQPDNSTNQDQMVVDYVAYWDKVPY